METKNTQTQTTRKSEREPKPERETMKPVEETLEEEYSDSEYEVEDGEKALRFADPKSGAERLNAIPPEVRNWVEMVPTNTSFSFLIDSALNRCMTIKSNEGPMSTNRMWHQRTIDDLMNVRRMVPELKTNGSKPGRVPPEVEEYFNDPTVHVLSLLQVLIDVVQQTGFAAKTRLSNEEQPSPNLVRESQDCRRLYNDLVTLYQTCCGKHKPFRQRNNNDRRQYNNDRPEYQYNDQRRQYPGNDQRRQYPSNDQRQQYNPGTYQMHDRAPNRDNRVPNRDNNRGNQPPARRSQPPSKGSQVPGWAQGQNRTSKN